MRIDRQKTVTYMSEEKCSALVNLLNETEDACGWTYHRDYNQWLTMKFAKNCALALMGWYLIAPPFLKNGAGVVIVNDHLPYAQWNQVEAFDSAGECESMKDKLLDPSLSFYQQASADDAKMITERFQKSLCVSGEEWRGR